MPKTNLSKGTTGMPEVPKALLKNPGQKPNLYDKLMQRALRGLKLPKR